MATYGKTYLQVVNAVLARLREDSVAAHNTTTYSTFIAALVNQVKNEIESRWHWHALRDTFSVAVTSSSVNYSLTDSGANAEILDGWNISTGQKLALGTVRGFNSKFFGLPPGQSVPTGSPCEYLPAGLDANYDITVDVYPQPAQNETLKFNVYVPQDDLAADATVTVVPQDVLIEEVIARALVERGEESAQPPIPGETFIRTDLLAAAISRDAGTDTSEMDWEPE